MYLIVRTFLVAQSDYVERQFIRTKINLISDDVLQVTWYALHHTSLFQRCPF
jgi:hypothetical protein